MQTEELNESLFEARLSLLKSADDADFPKFGGVASSENEDVDGDSILRKMLDISYISRRGYVNWNHSKAPEDQLGFITKAVIINPSDLPKFEDMLQVTLNKSASLYVEGTLYKHCERSVQVMNMLKSIPQGVDGAIGLSVEGGVLRTKDGIAKALVRGVAITPAPAQPETLCRLMKSLSLDVSSSVEGVMAEDAMRKGLTRSEAVVRIMEIRPNMPLELAKQIVDYTFSKVQPGGN